ncbi:MAG: tetratricopeptide repeat protein [Anaerolineae bacterium]|nr:tetratricopeptide repeat protein [Anaerolineae bacterium]
MLAEELVVESGIRNAEDLRAVLRTAELAVANLRGAGPQHALEFLRTLDTIYEAIPRLETEYGVDLKPERTRLETVQNLTRSSARRLMREVGAGRLAEARRAENPPEDHWWWYLDRALAAQRQEALRRWSLRAIVVFSLLLVGLVAYNRFLAPSPEEQAFSALLAEGESSLLSGDFEGAVDRYEAAVALNPGDVGARLHLGVVYEQLGRTEEAREQFEEAMRLSPAPADYHSSLSLVYYRVALGGAEWALERAEAEAVAALEADDGSAMAHFAMASVYELQGETGKAIEEFETASGLSSDPSLTVLARMRMGMLMQKPGETMGGLPGMGP